MAKKKNKPEAPVALLTLTEAQASVVSQALAARDDAAEVFSNAEAKVTELLVMVQPEGANGFDRKTMTFFSAPPEPPVKLDKE